MCNTKGQHWHSADAVMLQSPKVSHVVQRIMISDVAIRCYRKQLFLWLHLPRQAIVKRVPSKVLPRL